MEPIIPPPSGGIPIWVVDAFTREPFGGNPAAVCLPDRSVSDDWMIRVAAELNLSETAFLRRAAGDWELRWFTPTVEVDLCGHATLASAHVLWERGALPLDREAVFLTRRSGRLVCRRSGARIAMDFPARPAVPAELPSGLAEALGCRVVWGGRTAYDYLLEVPDAATVRSLRPDPVALGRLPVRGVIVTAPGEDGDFDFVSRFFAPGAGVAEDPVTGSAHCSLGPYWAGKFGRTELRGWQASARGGEVGVRVWGDRVELLGDAVTIWRGTLAV